ncbi:MAG: hypothetical protein APR53_10335 [Methanoculleus sp. SDB]|nr:MAG: hypothetical protein APR53_10335 [Methanoculleus sp. SDB]
MMNKEYHGSTRRVLCVALCAIICLSLIPGGVSAMRNPSAVYCEAMGYEYSTLSGENGETGICTMPGGAAVDAWDFLLGEEAAEYGYCARQGYVQKIVHGDACRVFGLDTCAVCVRDDGSEVEVSALMDLDFSEPACSSGACGLEAAGTDTVPGENPASGATPQSPLPVGIVVTAALVAGAFRIRR